MHNPKPLLYFNSGRKAQIEIMGLLVIVVLLALGLLFTLYFVLDDSENDSKQDVRESLIASSTLSVLRKTTTQCHQNTIEELLVNCARTRGSIICPNQKNSCEFADETISAIYEEFFESIKRDYLMTIQGIPHFADKKYGIEGGCKKEQESDEQPIPVGIGHDILIKTSICR